MLFSQIYSRSVSATTTQLGFGLPVNEAFAIAQASANPIHWGPDGCRICSAVALAGAGSIKQSSPVQVLDLCPCRRVLHHINYARACTPARAPEPQDKQEQDCWCWCVTLLFGRNGRGRRAALYSPGPGTGGYKRKRRKERQKVG
jgi:hypothetical protein